MQKKILFLSKGYNASSTRYRALQYFPLLEQNGFSAQHHTVSGGLFPFLSSLYYVRQADVVVLIRKTFPSPLFWLLRKLSKRLVFDFDDAIFCNTDGSDSHTRMSRFAYTVKRCDYVFAGNHYLAETAKAFQHRVSVIPTSLATAKYSTDKQQHNAPLTLVWIGSRSTKKYIAGILPAIESAAKTLPNLQLKIIADFSLQSNVLHIENIAWSEASEAAEIAASQVGLGPLPANNWTKGKCALKVLQYMAAGLPTISSPTGANAQVIEPLKSGFFANDDLASWETQIKAAYQSQGNLQKIGLAAQEHVVQHYDIHVVFKKMLNIIHSL